MGRTGSGMGASCEPYLDLYRTFGDTSGVDQNYGIWYPLHDPVVIHAKSFICRLDMSGKDCGQDRWHPLTREARVATSCDAQAER